MELFGDFLLHPPTQYMRLQISTEDTGVSIMENFCSSGFSLDEHPAKHRSSKNLIKNLLNKDLPPSKSDWYKLSVPISQSTFTVIHV